LHHQSRSCLGKMWLDLPFAQVSKIVEQNLHTTFYLPNPLSESEELQSWFCYHPWCDSTVIFDQISNSSNVYLSSSRLWTTISSVIFHQLPSVRNWECRLKSLIGSQPHSHKPFAPILVFLSQIDRLWNKILWQLSVHFHHPWRIKKTDVARQVVTGTLSKINKRYSVCERMLVDST